jgi:2-(1,2-epoxy-1,2-dihydrophenyl)acetyl-CoA isomerase
MPLDYAISGAVATITLNRPDVLNAIDEELGRALLDVTRRAARDDSVRCMVFTGVGKAFCSGEDLAALSSGYADGGAPDLGRIVLERYNPLITTIVSAPKPVVAALNGVAAGAGASIALACDARIASERAKLVLPFSRVGLVPDSGALFFLARMVGTARAWELACNAEVIGAERALDLGLVTEVAPAGEFETVWRSHATQLAMGPTRAYALTKALLAGAPDSSLGAQLEREAAAQRDAGRTRDHREGVRAFLDKRPPAFEGR